MLGVADSLNLPLLREYIQELYLQQNTGIPATQITQYLDITNNEGLDTPINIQ